MPQKNETAQKHRQFDVKNVWKKLIPQRNEYTQETPKKAEEFTKRR